MDWLTVIQAAEILGVTDSRVRQLIMDKRLTATQFGRKMWMIAEADLEAYRQSPPPLKGRPRKHTKESNVR